MDNFDRNFNRIFKLMPVIWGVMAVLSVSIALTMLWAVVKLVSYFTA